MTPTRALLTTLAVLLPFACTLRADAAPPASQPGATPKEVVGFWGKVTGTVKSAKADGLSFVLTITDAQPDEKQSAVKDSAPMIGKVITLGTRMPKKDGKPYPSPEDVAYIKSLKPGDTISVKIFAVRADPTVLRVQGPGEAVAAAPGDKKDSK